MSLDVDREKSRLSRFSNVRDALQSAVDRGELSENDVAVHHRAPAATELVPPRGE